MSSEGQASTQCDLTNTVSDVYYKLYEQPDKQVDRQSSVKNSDDNLKYDC